MLAIWNFSATTITIPEIWLEWGAILAPLLGLFAIFFLGWRHSTHQSKAQISTRKKNYLDFLIHQQSQNTPNKEEGTTIKILSKEMEESILGDIVEYVKQEERQKIKKHNRLMKRFKRLKNLKKKRVGS